MDRFSHLSNKTQSGYPSYQDTVSAVLGNTDHMRSPTYTFTPNPEAQFSMTPQLANSIDFGQQSYMPSTMSFKPHFSSTSTPESTFSAPLQQRKQKNETTEPGTPDTTVSTLGRADDKKTSLPSDQIGMMSERGWANFDGSVNAFDAGALSEESNSNPNWLSVSDPQTSQSQQQAASATYNDQHFNPFAAPSPSIATYSRSPTTGYEELTYLQQVAVGPRAIAPIAKSEGYPDSEFGPFLTAEEFPSPSLLDNYTFSTYGNNDTFMNGTAHNAYMQSQAGTHSYPANGFDFNDLSSTGGSYGLGITVPSNTQPINYGLGGHAVQQSSRSQQNNRDASLDQKLIAWRKAGMTYKQIKEKGIFGLEESTLRGRYRALTKTREQRLRKPDWPAHAVTALKEGVELLGPAVINGSSRKETLDKVPWKRVAEWMHEQRKCYLYGNATVKKKYKDLVDNGET